MAKEVPSMGDCATQPMRFETEATLALEAAFDGGRITSDGGLAWLCKMDSEMGLCEAHLRACAGVAEEEGTPFARFPRQATRLSDSLRLRGPK
jgi:hypothetical protein